MFYCGLMPTRLSLEEAIEHFLAQFDRSAGPCACHPWTGSIRPDGYGQANLAALGGTQTAHSLLWEIVRGEVPRDESGRKFHLDHECHNEDTSCPGGSTCLHRRCGNLEHIVAKARKANLDAANEPRARGRFRTHFDCGCEITEENTYRIERKGIRNGKPRSPERRCKTHERSKQTAARKG